MKPVKSMIPKIQQIPSYRKISSKSIREVNWESKKQTLLRNQTELKESKILFKNK